MEAVIGKSTWKDTIHRMAKSLYICLAMVYLFSQFMSIIWWSGPYYPASNIPEWTRYLGIWRYFLIPLVAEQMIRSWKRSALTLAVLLVSLWMSGSSYAWNNWFDFLAFLLLSDLADERFFLWVNLGVHLCFAFILAGIVYLDRTFGLYYYIWLVLGTINVNTVSAYLLAVLLLIWVLWLKRSRILTLIVFWAIAYPVYVYEDCQTMVVMLVLFPILYIVIDAISRSRHEKLLKALIAVPAIIMILDLAAIFWLNSFETVPYLYAPPWATFSQRFSDAANVLRTYGFTWFGNEATWHLQYTTDNLFLGLFVNRGIVPMLMVMAAFTWSIWHFYHKKRYDLMIITVLFMIYGIMENLAIVMLYNFVPMITLGCEKGIQTLRERKLKAENQNEVGQNPIGENSSEPSGRKGTLRIRLILTGAVLLLSVAVFPFLQPTREASSLKALAPVVLNTSVSELPDSPETVEQTFYTDQEFEGVRVLLATYGGHPMTEIRAAILDPEGTLAAEGRLSARIRDNKYQDLFLDRVVPPGSYRLLLTKMDGEDPVAIWQDDGNTYPDGAVIQNGTETEKDLTMYLVLCSEQKEVARTWLLVTAACLLTMIWIVPAGINRGRGT